MVNTLNSKSIKKAIETIESDYITFAKAAKMASHQFDFSRAIDAYVSFLNHFTIKFMIIMSLELIIFDLIRKQIFL